MYIDLGLYLISVVNAFKKNIMFRTDTIVPLKFRIQLKTKGALPSSLVHELTLVNYFLIDYSDARLD